MFLGCTADERRQTMLIVIGRAAVQLLRPPTVDLNNLYRLYSIVTIIYSLAPLSRRLGLGAHFARFSRY